jgi:mRNA interferase YafQ
MKRSKYTVKLTNRFKKDYKQAIKRGLRIELLDEIIALLSLGETLPEENKEHSLVGN